MTTNVIRDEPYPFYPKEEDDGWVVEILKDFDYDSAIIETNGNMYEEFLPLSNQTFCGQSINNQKSINQDAFVVKDVIAEDHCSTHCSILEFRNHQQNSFDKYNGRSEYIHQQYGMVNCPHNVQSTTVSEEHCGVQAAIIGQLSIETDANFGFSSFYDPYTHSNTFANHTGFIQDTKQQFELNEMSSSGISTLAPNAVDNQHLEFCYFSFGISNDKMAFYKYCYSKRNHLCSNKHAKSKIVAETAFPHNLDVEDYTFRRTINLKNAGTARLYVGATRNILFGNIAEKLNQKELKFADADRLIRESKNSESVYTFIEGLNIDIYSYENMQDLYFMFMTCKCLEYNQHLQCWVIRDDMWGLHVFLSEFYPYIVWYMEKLNNGEVKFELEAKLVTEYKSKLKEELKLLCIIFELYDEIKKFDNIFDVNGNYFGMINFLVEQWRKLIQKHLEKFYPTDRATSLYYVANEMCNANIYDKDINLFEQLDVMNPLFNNIAKQIKLFYMRSDRKHYAKALRGKVHLSYYKTIHFLNMTKNTAFILAFTVNFANMDPPIHDLEGIKNMKDKNGKGYHPAVIFRDYFFNQKTYNDVFEDTLTYVLYFINFIRDKKENRNTQKAIEKNYIDIRKFEKMMGKFTKKKTLTYVQRQVIYRSMLLIIIGLNIK